jgi:hypothetical protein
MTVTECLKKNNGNKTAAAEELGISRTALRRRLEKESGGKKSAPPVKASTARTLTEFKKTFDKDTIIPAKVKEALKELGSGWLYESEFVKAADVSYADLGNYRDLFSDHVVTLKREGKRAWAGTAALAKQMREMI